MGILTFTGLSKVKFSATEVKPNRHNRSRSRTGPVLGGARKVGLMWMYCAHEYIEYINFQKLHVLTLILNLACPLNRLIQEVKRCIFIAIKVYMLW